MTITEKIQVMLPKFSIGGLVTGSALLFVSTTIVNAGNYLSNLVLGRWLGPAAFADFSLIVTLLLILTLVTATLQMVSAKFAATYAVGQDLAKLAALRRWLNRGAWILGLLLLLALTVGAPFWQEFFHTASIWPFIIVALGIPVYLVQGTDRGLLQGQIRFGLLSLSYQAEMWTRLIVSIALVALGWGVNGAVFGVTLSLVATWFVAGRVRIGLPQTNIPPKSERRQVMRFAGPVGAALIGQILINNSDILITKHFFAPEAAGQYAALALIGRVVFFATWSVVAVMFPIVAQKHQKNEPHRHLLWLSLGLVLAVSAVIMAITVFVPETVVSLLFGPAYLSIAPLLWLYAIATMLYALANVYISYWLSLGDGRGSMLAVVGGVAQVLGLWIFHATLLEVVLVQIYIMTVLLAILIARDMWLTHVRHYIWPAKKFGRPTMAERKQP